MLRCKPRSRAADRPPGSRIAGWEILLTETMQEHEGLMQGFTGRLQGLARRSDYGLQLS